MSAQMMVATAYVAAACLTYVEIDHTMPEESSSVKLFAAAAWPIWWLLVLLSRGKD
jgi:hypothetical protein